MVGRLSDFKHFKFFIMKELSFDRMEDVQGGGINGCDVALGLVVGIWAAALGAASFGVGAFIVGYGGGLLVSYVCHEHE